MAVRAIIADGSPAVRDAVRQHLECIGCEVVAEVESAAHVLPIFRTIHPEIVALNISLACGGQSSPLDLLRLMRKESPATSIVMIGAEPMSPEGQTFVSEGALECVRPDTTSVHRFWRKLSLAYPELRKTRMGSILASAEKGN